MDAEIAKSVVDDAFEGLGTPDCLYQPPGGGSPVEGLVLILHRPSTGQAGPRGVRFSAGAMSFETDTQPADIIVRAADVPAPAEGGVFTRLGVQWRIGEAPVENDALGLSFRCSVVKA